MCWIDVARCVRLLGSCWDMLGRWCRAAGGFIGGEFVGPGTLPAGDGSLETWECAVIVAAEYHLYTYARVVLGAWKTVGGAPENRVQAQRRDCVAEVAARTPRINGLSLSRRLLAKCGAACVVSCRLSECWPLDPNAARAFPAVSNSSALSGTGTRPCAAVTSPSASTSSTVRSTAVKSFSVHVGSR